MHKLAKGLKKKKKKKDKKAADDDDFDPEELERYKRERAEAQQKQLEAAATGEGGNADGAVAGSDEWKKFQALTAGVDSILKKTQGDLDRIKSTSFFQRKPVESEVKFEADSAPDAKAQSQSKKWLNFDKDGNPIEESEEGADEGEKKNALEEAIVDIPDDDDDQEDSVDEDIFDTTYVDVLQNIGCQLAYIPDSPTKEELDDDPFDTTNADKVLKTVDKKTGKKLLSLGNAVEVLAGRIDHVSTCKIGRNRKQQSVDLLLDESAAQGINKEEVAAIVEESEESVSKTLLDDDADLPDIPVDLTKLPPVLPRPATPVTSELNDSTETAAENPPIDISEFEVLKEKTILEEIPDLEDDEFNLDEEDIEKPVLDETEDPFAEKEPENLDFENEIIEVSFEAKSNAEGEDPFDTTFAENILPGKTELKFIEKELEELPISEVSISLTDPAGLKRDYETGLLKLTEEPSNHLAAKKNDLLGSSATDLSQLTDEPIAPVEEITYVDPFDTSAIKELPPGKVELKFLEKELLGDSENKVVVSTLDSFEDDDFDPRKEETPVTVAQQPAQPRKASRPEVLELAPVKSVDFTLPTPSNRPDLLTTSEEEKNIPAKPLTPYYSQKSLEESLPEEDDKEEEEIDPFDTGFVSQIAPGKTELKILESELLSQQEHVLQRTLSDHEFDPRAEEVITATTVVDPIESSKRQGFASQRQESILDEEVDVAAKPLTPNIQPKIVEEEEISYTDPFDTSIATNILPGKTELKILENELNQIQEQVPVLPNPLSLVTSLVEEDDFDPRAGEEKEVKDYLCLDDQNLDDKVLTPQHEEDFNEDIDPFDTSFATLAPGKTELKLLESELVTK